MSHVVNVHISLLQKTPMWRRTGSKGVCPINPVHFLSVYCSFGCSKVPRAGDGVEICSVSSLWNCLRPKCFQNPCCLWPTRFVIWHTLKLSALLKTSSRLLISGLSWIQDVWGHALDRDGQVKLFEAEESQWSYFPSHLLCFWFFHLDNLDIRTLYPPGTRNCKTIVPLYRLIMPQEMSSWATFGAVFICLIVARSEGFQGSLEHQIVIWDVWQLLPEPQPRGAHHWPWLRLQ